MIAAVAAGLEASGWTIQTRRVSFTRPDPEFDLADVVELEQACAAADVGFCNLGAVLDPAELTRLAPVLIEAERLCLSILGAEPGGELRPEAIRAGATMMRRLALETEGGLGNFRFGVGFCVGPGAPFFPIAYADPERSPGLSIGTENSDLLVEAFANAPADPPASLFHTLWDALGPLEREAEALTEAAGCRYIGIDPSIAPALEPEASIARAFASLGVEIGGPGTVALCGQITACLRALPLAGKPGFAGLMLPVLEDQGLARALDEGRLGLADLLACASVCGVGLDTIPVAGDTPVETLEAVLRDLGTVAVKQDKPLAGRLLLAPGVGPGERTRFDSPHLCNAATLRL